MALTPKELQDAYEEMFAALSAESRASISKDLDAILSEIEDDLGNAKGQQDAASVELLTRLQGFFHAAIDAMEVVEGEEKDLSDEDKQEDD